MNGRILLTGGTSHLTGSERITNWAAMTDCSSEEPRECRVSVWEIGNWLSRMTLMTCI